MALTATEQAYYDHTKRSLPRFLFSNDAAAQELFGGFAVLFGSVHTQIIEWLSFTYLATATGIWLDQHARDRGTTRRGSETDATLRARLINTEDVVTRPALLAGVNAILTAAGFDPDAAMVELRRDKGYMEDSGAGNSQAFMSRGYRMGAPSRPHGFIVILPYDTDEATGNAVDEYLRKAKAAGYSHTVERRTSP